MSALQSPTVRKSKGGCVWHRLFSQLQRKLSPWHGSRCGWNAAVMFCVHSLTAHSDSHYERLAFSAWNQSLSLSSCLVVVLLPWEWCEPCKVALFLTIRTYPSHLNLCCTITSTTVRNLACVLLLFTICVRWLIDK